MAKQAKTDGDLDRISNFPVEILSHIISFLPTKEAVRTSIISTKWRYLFASIPNLDFDDSLLMDAHGVSHNVDSFVNFVDRLLSTKLNLEYFRLKFSGLSGVDLSRLYGWIAVALKCGVQKLNLDFAFENYPILPALLFTSKSLVALKLWMVNFVLNIPSGVCIPNLKKIHLSSIKFSDDDSVQRLFSSCPALEYFTIMDCGLKNLSELSISSCSLKDLCVFNCLSTNHWLEFKLNAPSLIELTYVDTIAKGYSLGNMLSLEEARIFFLLHGETYDDHEIRAATNLLQAIQNVPFLELTVSEPEKLPVLCHEPVLAFHNLVDLEIVDVTVDEDVGWQGTLFVEFLQYSPNLKNLYLYPQGYRKIGVWSPPENVPSCLLYHLKEFEIGVDIRGSNHLLKMIAYILENARVLEKLMVCAKDLKGGKKSRFAKKLMSLPRSSKECEIVVETF